MSEAKVTSDVSRLMTGWQAAYTVGAVIAAVPIFPRATAGVQMLHTFFFDSAASQSHGPALWVTERLYRYGEIETRARRVSAGLSAVARTCDARRCLLFGHRGVAASAAWLGILDAGMA